MSDSSLVDENEDTLLREETLIREGDDLLKICSQICSHTPQTIEWGLRYNYKPEGYTPNLERIVNIIKFYFELLLEFINLSPKVSSTFRKPKGVYTPELSAPALAYTLWTRLKFLTTESINSELSTISEELDKNRTSVETQTVVLSLTSCESCYLSQSVVKDLVSKIELFCSTHDITDSSVLQTKNQLRSKVHDMTEWNAMTEWCQALTTDIDQLTEISDKLLTNWKKERQKEKKRYEELKNKLKEAENKELIPKDNTANISEEKYQVLQNNNKTLKSELDQQREEIKVLTSKVGHFEEECQAEKNKNKKLLKELEENRKELQVLKWSVEDYKASSIAIKGDCKQLKNESENEKQNVKEIEAQVEAKINEASSIITQYELEMSKMNKRVEEMENESKSQQNILREQLKSLEIQEREINKCKKNEQEIKEKLHQQEEILQSHNNLKEDCRNLQKELDRKTKNEDLLNKKISILIKQTNNLSEHCEYLKERLKKYDPAYRRGAGEPLKELGTDTEESLHSIPWTEDDSGKET